MKKVIIFMLAVCLFGNVCCGDIPIIDDAYIWLVDGTNGNDANAGTVNAIPVDVSARAEATTAVTVTESAAGDTIIIYPATYAVTQYVGEALNIKGTCRESVIIQSNAAATPALGIMAAGIEIENITFTSAADATVAGVLSCAGGAAADRFVGKHLNINLTADAATAWAYATNSASEFCSLADVNIVSDWNGLLLDGSDNALADIKCVCSADEAGTIIGLKNAGIRSRVTDLALSVTNINTGSTGVIGVENDTTLGATMLFLSDSFVHVVDDHASASGDSIAVKAEAPMLIENCDLNVRVDGTGDSYGLYASDDVTLVNCTVTSEAGGEPGYSIGVAVDKTVTCIGCTYDKSATTGAGTILDLTDANGRVDVATINGATPITGADIAAALSTAMIADPTDYHVNLMEIAGDGQTVTDAADYFDTGYDPATHSVVLVNTTTANTDLVTAAAVVNEWETQSQADPNGFQVNVITVNSVATNLNELMDAADTDKVVTDSVIGKVASTDGDWSKFVKTTDALQSNRDKLPANLEDLSITDTTGIVKSNVTWWRDSSVLGNAINGMPLVDIGAINGIVSHATNLEAITTYLMANALTTLGDEIADNSILAKLMAADGDISDYNPATDAQESIINSLATVGGYIDDILKLSEADTKIDKTTDPDAWRIIFYEKGTANVLMTKLIKSVDGTAVKSEYTVIGQQVEAP